MLRASQEMGFGSEWKKALEAVKNRYVEPGQMIYLVRDLAREAVEFLEKKELVTIPAMVKEDYWEEALTPARHLVSPFFLGGSTIQVSSPANSMTMAEKMESLRGNNMFFARATVFHELIPGHHMQGYMTQRYRTYRSLFGTSFWTEGMAFYWEMLLWDLGFTHTPEQRVGALFWRMHRCARIIFSLSFHLGKMTAKECVEFLIERVGHERANAEGEVRRSFNGSYEPIYQCAYMLGALQFYAPAEELGQGARGRGSAAVVQRELRADLSVRVHAGGVAVLRAAQGTGGFGEDDESGVPRCAVPRGEYAGGDGAAGGERPEGRAGL